VYGSGKLAQSVVIQSQVFIMPKSAKNKEEGAKFLMFLQEEANLKELYDRTKAKVPNINFKNEWLSSEVDKKVASFLDQYPGFCYQYVYPANFEYEGLVPTVQRMFAEGLSAEAAARDLDAAIKKLAEQSPDQVEAYEIW
jgi:spermidine/putrescine-binding protein